MNKKVKIIILIIIIILLIGIVGITYAYFTYSYEKESALVGTVVGVDATLDVDLVVGDNSGLVPLNKEALQNALKGIGSDNGPCIDSAGNLSCQVYKITLVNRGSRIRHLNGTIELYAQDGEDNVYNNLKWIELEDQDTIKSDVLPNDMSRSLLVKDLTLESKEVYIWYIAVWLDNINDNQTETDKGNFGGIVKFESDLLIGDSFVENVLKRNAKSDENIDFSKTSEQSGTNGIYVVNSTLNDLHPIYYYRGQVDNNLIFADHCWKIVRTTDTGGLKLLYNGDISDNKCLGTNSNLGNTQFNSKWNLLSYVGYMYNDEYTYKNKNIKQITDKYYYGNDVKYENGVYTLNPDKDIISSSSWASIYNTGLNNTHYTCFSTGTTCDEVYYIYYTSTSSAYYITLTDGKKTEDAIADMLSSDEPKYVNANKKNSIIKGDELTSGTIDYWYKNNIEQYDDYIEDTIWCNDRTIYNIAGWNPNGGSNRASLLFSIYDRLDNTFSPKLTCSRKVDSFTTDDIVNGNGDLDYPVGLLTADEVMLAGGVHGVANSSYYLQAGYNYWLGTPAGFGMDVSVVTYISNTGSLTDYFVINNYGLRPSISLKAGFELTGNGNGTAENPYVIK